MTTACGALGGPVSPTAYACAAVETISSIALYDDYKAKIEAGAAANGEFQIQFVYFRRRVGDSDGFPTLAVLSSLLYESGVGARLRRGDGLSDSSHKATTKLLAINSRPSPAEFVDRVVDEVRSTLLSASGRSGDH